MSNESQKTAASDDFSSEKLDGDPYEIRTRVAAVKGRCLKPLDQGANTVNSNNTVNCW